MTNSEGRVLRSGSPTRRQAAKFALAAMTTASLMSTSVFAQTVDLSKWSPDYVKSIAGTKDFDAAKDCGAVVPNDYAGTVSYWYTGPFEADPQIAHEQDKAFWDAFHAAYPNIKADVQSITYNELLDKFRTALLGNSAPMVIRLQILGGVEFAAKGYLNPVKPEDYGFTAADFWPGALKSVTYDNTLYGLPTNNETRAFIWNAKVFKDAGLDPEAAPKTWDDVVAYSKQIHDKLGISGYGLVAKQNAGNTPFRFMPVLWAYGGGSLDEATADPTYKTVEINNAGSKAALQAAYQMYAVDKSVPVSALTNTQAENQAPFIAGQLGMMIAHPAEYAKMLDLASKATGADKAVADDVVANMRYGLMPTGPDGKRAVVFGGSNIHVVKPEFVDGGKVDEQAVKALICMWDSPEWSTRLAWVGSNPGNINGFLTSSMKQRLDTIKFLDVTTSMLPNGIPFPVLPESPEIMNIVIPDMLQNALTGNMTVDQATEDAAKKIETIIAGGGGGI